MNLYRVSRTDATVVYVYASDAVVALGMVADSQVIMKITYPCVIYPE